MHNEIETIYLQNGGNKQYVYLIEVYNIQHNGALIIQLKNS